MTRRQRRLTLIAGALLVLAFSAALVLIALKDSIVFFNSPTDVVEKHVPPGQRVRIGRRIHLSQQHGPSVFTAARVHYVPRFPCPRLRRNSRRRRRAR